MRECERTQPNGGEKTDQYGRRGHGRRHIRTAHVVRTDIRRERDRMAQVPWTDVITWDEGT